MVACQFYFLGRRRVRIVPALILSRIAALRACGRCSRSIPSVRFCKCTSSRNYNRRGRPSRRVRRARSALVILSSDDEIVVVVVVRRVKFKEEGRGIYLPRRCNRYAKIPSARAIGETWRESRSRASISRKMQTRFVCTADLACRAPYFHIYVYVLYV